MLLKYLWISNIKPLFKWKTNYINKALKKKVTSSIALSNLVVCSQQAARLPLLFPLPGQSFLLLLQLLFLLLEDTHGLQQLPALLLRLLHMLPGRRRVKGKEKDGENSSCLLDFSAFITSHFENIRKKVVEMHNCPIVLHDLMSCIIL